jgi:bifunctional non-homologous end joining protein LigD
MPLGARYTYEQAKDFAHLFVIEVNKRQPGLTSLDRMPKKRPNKIYLDFLQNRSGQTLAAPYSLRPHPDACVSTPLHWSEVTPALKPTNFTIKNIHRRLGQVGDLWNPVIGKGIDLQKILDHLSH